MKKNNEQIVHLWIPEVQVKEYWVLSNPFWNHCCSILEDTGAREQSQSGKGTLVGVRGPTKSSAYLYWSRLELPTFQNGWWQYTRLARDEHLSLGPACVSWFRSMWYITLDTVDMIHHRDHILSIISECNQNWSFTCKLYPITLPDYAVKGLKNFKQIIIVLEGHLS